MMRRVWTVVALRRDTGDTAHQSSRQLLLSRVLQDRCQVVSRPML